jgi:type I restriction enzyme M protein
MATGSSITAKAGDLLVARVGRRLEQKICTVSFGKVIPSDCFLRVRPRAGCGRKLLELLTSSNGRASIERISHGVGAQFITIRALVNIRI